MVRMAKAERLLRRQRRGDGRSRISPALPVAAVSGSSPSSAPFAGCRFSAQYYLATAGLVDPS